jgi:hypothetical protein
MSNRELYNVLDKLKEIAESNDSEDVAAAIEQLDAYSFKGRLAEMEKANSGKVLKENCSSVLSDEEIQIVHQFLRNEIDELPGDMEAKLVDFYADEIPYGWLNGDDGTPQDWLFNKLDMEYGDEVFGEGEKVDYDEKDIDDFFGGPDSTKVNEEDPWCLGETPGDDDDQYCATCGNTGERLDQTGEPCPNCADDISDKYQQSDDISYYADDDPENIDRDHQWPGKEEDEVSALKRITDRVAQRNGGQEVEEAVNPVDVKDAMKHLYQLLQSGLDPETKEAVQNAYIELKQKAAQEGGQA